MGRPILGLIGLAVSISVVWGQPQSLPSPRLDNVFPAGAQRGSAIEVTVRGKDLEEPTGLLFSHPGLVGEYIPPPPPDPKQKTPSKEQREQAASRGPHTFKVTVGKDVPPGVHDLRVVTRWGVSNPRAFIVGTRPEVNEKEPNNDLPEAQRVEIGTTINGIISSNTDVDYMIFPGKQGQRVLLHAAASLLDGKARPLVEVFDPTGRKIAQGRNYLENDALVDTTLPIDGDYVVRVSEFAYAGGSNDHVYRLTIVTDAWVDAVFPPVVEAGKPTEITLYGRNLPGSKTSSYTWDGRPLEALTVKITPPADPKAPRQLNSRHRFLAVEALQDGFEYRLPGSLEANSVTLYYAREKIQLRQPNQGLSPQNPCPITPPVEVVSMIEGRGDQHWYQLQGKKGQVLMLDLQGERIGTPADFFFSVHDPANQNRSLLGEIDDDSEPLHVTLFSTRSTDPPPVRWTVPTDGVYLIRVGAREAGIAPGPRLAYRLRVAPPRPDFRIVAMPYARYLPTGSTAWQDGTVGFDLFIHRRDNFMEPVTITATGLPAGVTARPLILGPAARWGVLPLRIAKDAPEFTGFIQLTAHATLNGQTITDTVRPASLIWGNKDNPNQPLYCRLTQGLALAVRARPTFFAIAPQLDKATVKVNNKDEKAALPLSIKQGERLTVPFTVRWFSDDKPSVTLSAEPPGPNNVTNNLVAFQIQGQPTKDKPEATLTIEARNNAQPGTYSLVVRGSASVTFTKDATGSKMTAAAAEYADPVPFRILPAALARITVPQGLNLKAGESVELPVKVERLFDYAGEFRVAFTPPPEIKGLTAQDVVIPPGQDEARLTLRAEATLPPTAINNALLKVTALFDGDYPVVHETRVSLNIRK